MNRALKDIIQRSMRGLGYQIKPLDTRPDCFPANMNPDFRDIYLTCEPYSMTSIECMYAVYQSVHYIVQSNLPGALVECGVWRGGSAMVMALTLAQLGITDRKIYLYDTYEGMAKPTSKDQRLSGDEDTMGKWQRMQREGFVDWCYSSLEEVRNNLAITGYPTDNLLFIQGKVEDTIPDHAPDQIALLRLDTDWYNSTKHELLHLYPLLQRQGVLLVDDYGHWAGQKQAVDEYFANRPLLMNRIDSSSISAIKT